MDHHTVAAVSMVGVCLDVLGSLYLAYDLLGGQHGPLRLLTRMVTYTFVFGIGYGLGLGLFFGITSGIANGITVGIELQRTGYRHDHYPLRWEIVFSAIRGFAFGAGVYQTTGFAYALTFSALITAGQVVAYLRGMRPSVDYAAFRRPRFTRRQLWGTVIRAVGYTGAALICSALVRHLDHPWTFALRLGLITGIVTGVIIAVYPYIEYYADNLPQRRMGAFGILLLLCGFLLESLQYLVVLFGVPIT
jgi:hypothetical protein